MAARRLRGDQVELAGGLVPRRDVRLAFTRPRPAAVPVGARWVHVDVNEQVLTAYDIRAAAGAMNKAIAPQFAATANASGQYVIQFTTVVNNGMVSGIEIQCYAMGEDYCKFLTGSSKKIDSTSFWLQEGASSKEIIERLTA